MKKILSYFLIFAALVSLSVPAFAATDSEYVDSKVAVAYGRSRVTVTVCALEDTTNGQLNVTYDASALTLASADVEGETTAVDGKTKGVVELGYASTEPLKKNSVLAVLEFTYDSSRLTSYTTKVGVSVVSFNANEEVNKTTYRTIQLVLPVVDTVGKEESKDEATVDTNTTTTVNEDGSVTETTTTTQKTENKDGSVTETVTVVEKTENTDGSTVTSEIVTETITAKDGTTETVTTEKLTTELADGTTAIVTTAADGKSEAEVSLSETAVESGETVTLPVSGSAVESVTVSIPENTTVKVEVPVENVTAGTVLVIVHEDGTEEVVKKSTITEDGVAMTLTEGATLKVVENAMTFDDVKENYWGGSAIDFVSARGLMVGDGTGAFDPEAEMNRGSLAVMLHNLESNPEAAKASVFNDMSATWYVEAVKWVAAEGIMGGYGNGEFGVSDNVTREQFAAILYRYAGSPATNGSVDGFTDADQISDWASDAMRWAVENGIMNGDGGELMPTGFATRAQVAAMLMRFMSL